LGRGYRRIIPRPIRELVDAALRHGQQKFIDVFVDALIEECIRP
jgi:hypothetical protein